MKLTDAIKHKGNPFWIPDCSRDELPQFFKEIGFKVGAEIGVYKGNYTRKFCESGLKMYAIDPWDPALGVGRYTHPQERHDSLYENTKRLLAPYPDCTVIRKTSMDALDDIPDRSLDFVYIDGNHQFGYVAMDLMQWANKVRQGGMITGHDYYFGKVSARRFRMVRHVVDAFAKGYDFTNWYVLGSENPTPNEKFDPSYSFIFIKHW